MKWTTLLFGYCEDPLSRLFSQSASLHVSEEGKGIGVEAGVLLFFFSLRSMYVWSGFSLVLVQGKGSYLFSFLLAREVGRGK